MREKKGLLALVVAVLAILAFSVLVQHLVRQEVVVGLPSNEAHSHGHDEEAGSHTDEGTGESGGDDANGRTSQEGQTAAEVPLDYNLIPNYGFEAGTREQIWGWMKVGQEQGETVYRDLDMVRSGLASAAVATNGTAVNNAGWVTGLDEMPLQYEVVAEGYIRTEGLTGGAFLRVTLETKDEGSGEKRVLDWVFSEVIAGDSDWTLCRASIYVPPETTAVWLQVGVQGQGRAWFDDISLVAMEPY